MHDKKKFLLNKLNLKRKKNENFEKNEKLQVELIKKNVC